MKLYQLILLCLISCFSFAQNKSLENQWKVIDKGLENGQFASLSKELQVLKNDAAKLNAESDYIKALFYEAKIKLITTDDTDDVNFVFNTFSKEINGKSKVRDAVLNMYLAKLYQLYLAENNYKIRNRTELENQTSNDVRFWTNQGFINKINQQYKEALKEKQTLLKENPTNWKNLFLDSSNNFTQNKTLTPTLYDIIADDYIDFLIQENESDKIHFYIDELASLNIEKGNFNAFLFNQNKKLDNLKKSISVEEYLKEKESLASFYFNDAWYSATIYNSYVDDLMNQQKLNREDYLKIFEIEKKLLAKYPDLAATKSISQKVNNIKSKSYSVNFDNYAYPNENIPINVTYKNIDKLFVRIYKYDAKFNNDRIESSLNVYNKDKLKEVEAFIKTLKVNQEYTIDLKNFDDYQNHSTVVKLNPLSQGTYIILFSSDSNFDINSKENAVIYNLLSVSQHVISLNNKQFYVQDRNTGKPLVNKVVEVTNPEIDNAAIENYTTNQNGIVNLTLTNRRIAYRVKGDPVIYRNYSSRNYEPDFTKNQTAILAKVLTDRAIYRPNQTVYFKTIVYKTDNKKNEIVPNLKVDVILRDVNSKQIAQLEGITNDFGSFSGEFQLPASVLTGNFTISVIPQNKEYYSTGGSATIKVEEYKRPKFEVKIEENKAIYQFNDKVKIDGFAEAFSGAKIDNAIVKYRVYREEIYLFRPYYRLLPNNNSQGEEITFGETKTDNEGKFSFDFIAKAATEKQDFPRLYSYKIEVNVTDINGETQTTTSTIKVSDNRYIITIGLANKVNVEALKDFDLSVTNINGVKQNVKGKVEIYSLKAPNRVLRESSFTSDYNYYSESEFRKLFPNQPYGDENTPGSWKLDKKVFETKFNTEISLKIQFNDADKLEENYYKIIAYVDDEKGDSKTENLIYFINPKKQNKYTLLNVTTDKEEYKVGDKAKVVFNSSNKEGNVYYSVRNGKEEIVNGLLDLKKSNSIIVPINEDALGGIAVSYFIVNNNVIFSDITQLNVPYPEKDLKITTEVFRDKLRPGEKEKWQLKIAGINKDKISAEVLATMYDASLDQFVAHNLTFNPNLFAQYRFTNSFNNLRYGFGLSRSNPINNIYDNNYYGDYFNGLDFTTFDLSFSPYRFRNEIMYKSASPSVVESLSGKVSGVNLNNSREIVSYDQQLDIKAPTAGTQAPKSDKISDEQLNQVQARKVLDETAFFYPNLKTDENGNVIIEFTAPESLTEWKLMTLAHTKDLKTGYLEQRIKTQKELMIVPNLPRFLREGDQVIISAKVNNLSDNALNGTAKLMLFDAFTMQPIDAKFGLKETNKNFSTTKGSSDQVSWTINVPKNVQAVVYRVVAAANNFTDGEESVLPVLTNRMLVTETMPIYIKENQSKSFTFDHLKNNQSKTLDNYKLTFEMTTNPIWNAVFALPYLREYPYECAEQVFSRLYGNIVSEKIVSSNPKIKAVFDDWNKKGELKSKLQVNEELKNIILEETPWLRSAESEEQQQKQIAALFQMNQMQYEMKSAFEKLAAKQQSNGGFAWFDGGYVNDYITTYIVSGFGNLKKMNVNFKAFDVDVNPLIENAVKYIDQVNLKKYKEFKSNQKEYTNIVYSDGIHYLYARSFFLDQFPMNKEVEEMKNVMLKNLNAKKLDLSLQQKAMASLVLNRYGLQSAAKMVLNSVKETAVLSDEMGMYWKANQPGWFWYQAPIETQASLIEAFDEVLNDEKSVEEMKIWLLKNKQVNQWNSTKATTQAVYALMNTGKSWIDAEKGITVKIADKPFDLVENAQSGSGYVQKTWNGTEIKSDLGKVEVSKTSPGVAWGAMYWQYFEDLDQIKSANTGIKFNKKLYIKQNTVNGPLLKEITTQTPIKIGDIVTIRLEISVDRDMQFIHIKDLRASGFEPVNVLSGYRWKGEFGYYESTRDVATNFFADYMRKGTYVFEYDLKANNAGNYSNGITSMQNMYAPELSAQSEGIRVEIK